MGQKVHPYSFRLGVSTDWKSKWFSNKDYVAFVNEDWRIRDYLKKELVRGAVSRVDIERTRDRLIVDIHTARPGVVIGRKGSEAERLRGDLEALAKRPVKLNINEVKDPDLDAALLARGVADQIENRIAFRRAMKRAIAPPSRPEPKGFGSSPRAVSAGPTWVVASGTARDGCRCTLSEPTSITGPPPPRRPLEQLASRCGYIGARSSAPVRSRVIGSPPRPTWPPAGRHVAPRRASNPGPKRPPVPAGASRVSSRLVAESGSSRPGAATRRVVVGV